jgi:hypothetical protein
MLTKQETREMKIIAQVKKGEYLVQASEFELNKISGKYKDHYRTSNEWEVNTEIEIQKNWDFLDGILKKQDQLKNAASNLRAMADMMERIPLPVTDQDQDK